MLTRPKRTSFSKYLAWLPGVALSGLLLWFLMPGKFHSQVSDKRVSSSGALTPRSPLTNKESIRRVYPYSVIPGGVQNIKELTDAIGRDPLVAAHYLGFDVTSAQLVRLTRDRMVYVSYRRENQIYWTKKKLKLVRGETLITDGKHSARTRCGNLVSETRVGPVSPHEPSEQTLDTPQSAPSASPTTLANLNLPLWRPSSTVPQDGTPWPAGVFPPLVGPIGGVVQNSAISQNPIVQNTSNGQNPTVGSLPTQGGGSFTSDPGTIVTPEPATITLVSSGIAALWLWKRKKR
jgi:hypothetical protein